jgi:mannose-6-phosphate isomerase-like protein (cupin superfamily)
MKYVPKGWGYEKWIVNKPEYCGKILFIAQDRKLSLHYHKLKDETFYIQDGDVDILYYKMLYFYGSKRMHVEFPYIPPDKVSTSLNWDILHHYRPHIIKDGPRPLTIESLRLQRGDTFYVPRQMRHALIANRDTTIIEFSTEHFDSDSYRILKGD